ncbi:hypothetical protein [Bdellovibrio sp. HCB2-146]|uniref:hypothetical protein n=1 Tax=Bdellovibrio sp. HCB2-146 TaxID=3394362 RepID=UPI0039BC4D1D
MKRLTEGQLELFLFEREKEAVSHSEKRVLVHLRIKEMLQKGEYYSAIEAIQLCFHEKGEHLGLWCDLAACYYLTQQYGLWALTLQKIENLLREFQKQISDVSLTKTRMMLAKFFEETGDLQKSLSYWMECLEGSDIELILRARINIVRLLALYPLGPELTTYYRDLKPALRSKLAPTLEIEILHALSLAEVSLLGPATWSQLKELIDRYEIGKEDQALLYFDICDLIMRTGEALPESLVHALAQLTPVGPYEACLKNLALKTRVDQVPWLSLATEMPVGNFLRLASLALTMNLVSNEEAVVLKRQIELTLLGFTPKDRQVWQGLLPSTSSHLLSAVLTEDMKLVINDRFHLNLTSKKKIYELLSHLSSQKSMSLEELTEKIYEAEYNESYFHRLRRLAKRFNDEVLAVGAPALLEVKDGQINLLADLKNLSRS